MPTLKFKIQDPFITNLVRVYAQAVDSSYAFGKTRALVVVTCWIRTTGADQSVELRSKIDHDIPLGNLPSVHLSIRLSGNEDGESGLTHQRSATLTKYNTRYFLLIKEMTDRLIQDKRPQNSTAVYQICDPAG